MKHTINASLQILPTTKGTHPYKIVDKAIEIIRKSGLSYKVCPFETVMEGSYDEIMQVIKQVHQTCLESDTESIFSYIKLQISKSTNVSIGDKIDKYR